MTKLLQVIASFLFLLLTTTVRAQVEKITLRVDGLAWPFCAYGLEKKLKQLKGARSWRILLNKGEAVLEWRAAGDQPQP